MRDMDEMNHCLSGVLERHERIALQVSGGKDSLAVLELLRAHWHKMTVYWLNTGAAFPETVEVIGRIRQNVPHFVEVQGNQPHVVATFGIPSDIVPVSRTELGIMVSGKSVQMIQDRYACCARVLMNPMHERMVADEITLIIRGQRDDDTYKSPLRSGDVVDGVELLFPIEDWTQGDVISYLTQKGIPIPRFYRHLNSAPDCMTCSAWWENGAAKYLKKYHPDMHREVQTRLDIINEAVGAHIAAFNTEVGT